MTDKRFEEARRPAACSLNGRYGKAALPSNCCKPVMNAIESERLQLPETHSCVGHVTPLRPRAPHTEFGAKGIPPLSCAVVAPPKPFGGPEHELTGKFTPRLRSEQLASFLQ